MGQLAPLRQGGGAGAGQGGAVHVDPELERAWFQPLNLKCDILVSKFAFKCCLYRYGGEWQDHAGAAVRAGRGGRAGQRREYRVHAAAPHLRHRGELN